MLMYIYRGDVLQSSYRYAELASIILPEICNRTCKSSDCKYVMDGLLMFNVCMGNVMTIHQNMQRIPRADERQSAELFTSALRCILGWIGRVLSKSIMNDGKTALNDEHELQV